MLMRHLDKQFSEKLINSVILEFYKQNSSELFLGIRNNYINLYYRGASVCKAYEVNNSIRCEIAKKYLDTNNDSGYAVVSFDVIQKNYSQIKTNIECKYSHNEKIAQQRLILNNNLNNNADCFCIDMEYIKQREDSNQDFYGRADIVAVSKLKPYKVIMIELKYGKGAIGGSSGIVKHLTDYKNFIEKNEFKSYLDEVIAIINSYELIGCPTPFGHVDRSNFSSKPEIKFITLAADNSVKGTMRRYIFKDEKGCSVHNFEDDTSLKFSQLPFKPEFLFSVDDGKNIDDIINSSLYKKGL